MGTEYLPRGWQHALAGTKLARNATVHQTETLGTSSKSRKTGNGVVNAHRENKKKSEVHNK